MESRHTRRKAVLIQKLAAILWSGSYVLKALVLPWRVLPVASLLHNPPNQFLLCGALGEQIPVFITTSRQKNLVS